MNKYPHHDPDSEESLTEKFPPAGEQRREMPENLKKLIKKIENLESANSRITFAFPHFARNLRERREKIERPLAWVARKAAISKTYLWELENDQEGKKCVSAAVLWRLATLFGCTMESLLGAADGVPDALFEVIQSRKPPHTSPRQG